MATKATKSRRVNDSGERQGHQASFARWFIGHIFSLFRRHGNFLAGCLLVAFCVMQASDALKAFAGRQSNLQMNVWLGLLASLRAEFIISIVGAGGAIGLYLRERKKHRQTRERLADRIKSLELLIDPSRTSSHLTSKGLTRKDDE